uniref:Uncharacterized protein n=1 Tax=Panagrellus redivivus TaxID=6233 RepID=A0A7E4VD37_PANRE
MCTSTGGAFFDLFWIKELHSPPEVASFFVNRTVELLMVLSINTVLATFVFYVILTQSASLGSFKYYLLNQLIWAQILEFGLLLTCPVFVGPCLGAFLV